MQAIIKSSKFAINCDKSETRIVSQKNQPLYLQRLNINFEVS